MALELFSLIEGVGANSNLTFMIDVINRLITSINL